MAWGCHRQPETAELFSCGYNTITGGPPGLCAAEAALRKSSERRFGFWYYKRSMPLRGMGLPSAAGNSRAVFLRL